MSDAWIPVFLAAIVVLGVVGGQIIHTLSKRALPLLEDLAKQKRRERSGPDAGQLSAKLSELETRIAQLEDRGERFGKLEEEVSFLQRLLEERSESQPVPGERPQ